MTFFQELLNHLIGNVTPAYFVSTIIFVLLGACITVLFDVYTRNKDSDRTPEPFNWFFFWKDNWFRFALNILIAIALVRFFVDVTGIPVSMFWAFATGLVFDGMIIIYKKIRKAIKSRLSSAINGLQNGTHNS